MSEFKSNPIKDLEKGYTSQMAAEFALLQKDQNIFNFIQFLIYVDKFPLFLDEDKIWVLDSSWVRYGVPKFLYKNLELPEMIHPFSNYKYSNSLQVMIEKMYIVFKDFIQTIRNFL